ncbi:MAG: hypothetical protein U0359_21200 [Byssovorax sp.]
MNGKQNLDDLLRAWPAPALRAEAAQRDEKSVINADGGGHWDTWAEAIVKAATSAGPPRDEAALAALTEAPPLPAEAGEPGGAGDLVTKAISAGTGEIKMSQENEPGPIATEEPSSPQASAPPPATSAPERKRSSLKAFAEKASVRPATMPPVSTPAPAPVAVSTPAPSAATVTPLPGARLSRPGPAPVSRPVEAGADDSGVVNLNIVKETATAQQIAAAEKAKPGQADLFEDDKPAEKAEGKPAEAVGAAGAKVIPITAAKPAEPKKGGGATAGIVIALLGVAAAFAIWKMQAKPAEAPPVVSESKPMVVEPKQQPAAVTAAPTSVAAVEPTATVAATAEPDKADAPKVASTATGGPLPSGAATVAAKDPAADKLAANTPPAKDAPPGKPGDLASEMAKAVGGGDTNKPKDGTPEPAAANPKNQNIPEQPSQGSVQSAIGAVMGGAKACVAGADDVSRANVTFGSAGAVSSVSVTGWASAHGKSGCVQAALKAAKVGPFSKPSFTVGVTIRP